MYKTKERKWTHLSIKVVHIRECCVSLLVCDRVNMIKLSLLEYLLERKCDDNYDDYIWEIMWQKLLWVWDLEKECDVNH